MYIKTRLARLRPAGGATWPPRNLISIEGRRHQVSHKYRPVRINRELHSSQTRPSLFTNHLPNTLQQQSLNHCSTHDDNPKHQRLQCPVPTNQAQPRQHVDGVCAKQARDLAQWLEKRKPSAVALRHRVGQGRPSRHERRYDPSC